MFPLSHMLYMKEICICILFSSINSALIGQMTLSHSSLQWYAAEKDHKTQTFVRLVDLFMLCVDKSLTDKSLNLLVDSHHLDAPIHGYLT